MSSSKLNDPSSNTRDYGATSPRHGNMSNLPEVNFSEFSPTEVMSLSEDIGHNIDEVNRCSKRLERLLKDIATPNDRQEKRDEIQKILSKTSRCIETTSKDLVRLASITHRGDKQQKLQLEKLTSDFGLVGRRYTKVQNRIVVALRQTLSQISREYDEPELQQHQLQVQIDADLVSEEQLLRNRTVQIEDIEENIKYLNEIMCKIANIVAEQGTMVEIIEDTVTAANIDISVGCQELAKTNERRQSHRRKICIFLAIAVIIGLIVTGIIVAKFKS